ncbi:MAG: glycosyltransferase family protein [Magnetococcales bacterium]|nr:glycosyltransferase family protein [Magnetococcales bacterium]
MTTLFDPPPPSLFDQAIIHHRAGQWHEARHLYQTLLSRDRHHLPTLVHLGLLHQQQEEMNAAIACFRQALGQSRDSDLQSRLTIPPEQPHQTANLIGIACHQSGRLQEALDQYTLALRLNPDYPSALSNRGFAYIALGRPDEAAQDFNEALRQQPDFPEAHANLGMVFHDQGRHAEAQRCFRNALQRNPAFTQAWYNLGLALQAQGRFDEALEALRQARSLDPEDAEAALALSLLLLLKGDYRTAWPLHEWRWNTEGFHHHGHPQPLWDGRAFTGKTLLLHCEQGFGDNIQFIRYIPQARQRGTTVIVQCPLPLASLFRTVPDIGPVIASGQPLPPCDLQAPLASLPLIFDTTLETIPRRIPYLAADPHQVSISASLLPPDDKAHHHPNGFLPPLNVGLAWRGNPKHRNDRNRSIDPALLATLCPKVPCLFIGLQKDKPPEDLLHFTHHPNFIDLSPWLADFAATAAIMSHLDLVIGVDSAVIHLAGALGHPAWVLLPKVPDWRWGIEGDQTPWYPTLRLFRQSAIADWNPVLRQVAKRLHILSSTRHRRLEPGIAPDG